MPFAPKKPCKQPGCPALTDSRFCPAHTTSNAVSQSAKQYDAQRGNSAQRGYDAQWQKFRLSYLNRFPMCQSDHGCERPAEHIHHIIKLSDGGAKYDESNCQGLCQSHHNKLRGAGGRA